MLRSLVIRQDPFIQIRAASVRFKLGEGIPYISVAFFCTRGVRLHSGPWLLDLKFFACLLDGNMLMGVQMLYQRLLLVRLL